ncbi:hypothetical protein P167DRAFT_576652 [Morchella conica CCBAS932]|uniref:Uncharacterized protein n=1 Tax=Morchella conica CCBAS932 TaxID=1392247 RepID=A0A3N4KKR0_9PEZI|nr:hypothetical protein P167DRAFT_576652 [Morchella conica CCBAS932]
MARGLSGNNPAEGGTGKNGSNNTRRPIGRLDITDETTYTPQEPAENSGITTSKDRRENAQRMNSNKTTKHGPSTFGRIVILSGVGSTLLESDIRRMAPTKAHIPEFQGPSEGFSVVPYRFPKSLARKPFYNLLFESPEAARDFVYAQGDFWLFGPKSTIPPGQTPTITLPSLNTKKIFDDYRLLSSVLSRGRVGQDRLGCVLLTLSDIGGNTRERGKLPRTAEMRELLENDNVKFCRGDETQGDAGLERVLFERVLPDGTVVVDRFDGSENGAEAKWIVRCRDAAEAHRVVRNWHKKEFREGGGKFHAEMIY